MAIVLKLEMAWDAKYEDLESPAAKILVASLTKSVSRSQFFFPNHVAAAFPVR